MTRCTIYTIAPIFMWICSVRVSTHKRGRTSCEEERTLDNKGCFDLDLCQSTVTAATDIEFSVEMANP